MAFFDFLNPILDFIFGPLLKLPPFWAILLLSLILSVLIVLIYKWTTNQTLMKQLRDDVKNYQQQMKQQKEDPKKVLEIQKKIMDANIQLMKHSFKPTLITLLPIILIFGWVNAHFAFEPLLPGQPFPITIQTYDGIQGNVTIEAAPGITVNEQTVALANNQATFTLQGNEGEYLLTFMINNKTYEQTVLISKERAYKEPVKIVRDKTVKTITVGNKKTVVMNLFGWRIGWIGSYIIFSIVFSLAFRRLLKAY